MAKEHDAALAIKRVVNQLDGFMQAAALLEEIGNAKQMRDECQAAAEQARVERDKARDDEAKAKAHLKLQKEKADGVMIEAAASAAITLKQAEERAAGVEKQAQDKAAAMLAQASAEVARLSALNTERIEKAKADLHGLHTQIGELDHVRAEKAKDLADIEKALGSAQAKLRKLLEA